MMTNYLYRYYASTSNLFSIIFIPDLDLHVGGREMGLLPNRLSAHSAAIGEDGCRLQLVNRFHHSYSYSLSKESTGSGYCREREPAWPRWVIGRLVNLVRIMDPAECSKGIRDREKEEESLDGLNGRNEDRRKLNKNITWFDIKFWQIVSRPWLKSKEMDITYY